MSRKTSAIRQSFGKLFSFLMCFVVALGIYLLTMQSVAPEETRTFSSIAVTVHGGESETTVVTASFTATKTELYRYKTKGITASVDLTNESLAGEYVRPLVFYVEGKEIKPDAPVTVCVTVTE